MIELSICENPEILRIIYFIKILVNYIKIIVPIGLIIMLFIDFSKGVIGDDKEVSKILKATSKRIIAAMLIFFVPTIINFVLMLVDEKTAYESCWVNANKETILYYQSIYDELELQEKEENENKEETEEDNNKYDSLNSHTNSVNRIKYTLYNQSDSRWEGVYFSNGQSISQNGCMITSVAVISSAADNTITPLTVFNSAHRHSYPYYGINSLAQGSFVCKNESIDYDGITSNLKKGNVAVIKVEGKSNFTNSQHYMALIDIKSDGSQIYVGNSYDSGTGSYNRTGWFDTNVVLTDVHELSICVPTKDLYDKYN